MSVIFVYPLESDLYGLFHSMYSYAVVLVPLFGLGIQGTIVKYYPIFAQKGKSDRFLSFTLWLTLFSSIGATIILGIIYYLFRSKLFLLFDNFKLIDDHLLYILGLGYILTFSSVILYHAVVRYRIVIPDLINTIGLKFFLPLLILAIYFGTLNKSWFLYICLIYFILVGLTLLIYVLKLDNHKWCGFSNNLERSEYRGFATFMIFSLLNGLGASLALRLDINMIGAMLNVQAVAVYAIILTISNVMEIPAKAINQIASPVVSTNWASKEKSNIQDVYQKSSLYGLIAGVYLFLILYFIWVDLLKLMPGKFGMDITSVLLIFSFLSFARIVDLVSGINSIIISYSKDYKFHMYFLIILAVVNLVLNYVFLKRFGLIGAAVATSISYVLFNVLKHYFVKLRFGFKLNFEKHLYILIAGSITFLILFLLPVNFHPILNIIIKCGITTISYGLMIYGTNPGGEIKKIVSGYLQKMSFNVKQ